MEMKDLHVDISRIRMKYHSFWPITFKKFLSLYYKIFNRQLSSTSALRARTDFDTLIILIIIIQQSENAWGAVGTRRIKCRDTEL